MTSRRLATTAAVLALICVAGCSHQDQNPSPADSTTTTTSDADASSGDKSEAARATGAPDGDAANENEAPKTNQGSKRENDDDHHGDADEAGDKDPSRNSDEATMGGSKNNDSDASARRGQELNLRNNNVKKAYEKYKSLAPATLFEKFDDCSPSNLPNTISCTSEDAGQFFFSSSQSNAAKTTQALTGLRSSRIVEDSGKRIVGWQTLGSDTVITVVDNERGLILKQPVFSDEVDPEAKIYELGLVEKD